MGICRAVCCMVRGWMRYAALPPAFMRGVPPVRKLVAGGVRYPHLFHKKRTRNKDGKNRKVMLFYALLPEIRTPPVPALAQGHPPHKCGGRGRLRRQLYKFQFIRLMWETGKYIILYLISYILYLISHISYLIPLLPASFELTIKIS